MGLSVSYRTNVREMFSLTKGKLDFFHLSVKWEGETDEKGQWLGEKRVLEKGVGLWVSSGEDYVLLVV